MSGLLLGLLLLLLLLFELGVRIISTKIYCKWLYGAESCVSLYG